jgi:tetratricopeptide (TPR) repeat protein
MGGASAGELDGKVAIVTGGNSGIGRVIVLALVRRGARVAIDYVAHPEATAALERQVAAMGGRVVGIEADVSQIAALDRLIARTVGTFGRLDVMINNAGVETRTDQLWIQLEGVAFVALFAPIATFVILKGLALALFRAERQAETVAAYREAISLDPESADLHHMLGVELDNQRLLPEAEAAFRRAIELDPTAASYLNNLGVVLARQGRNDEAAELFRRALAIDPEFEDAQTNLSGLK